MNHSEWTTRSSVPKLLAGGAVGVCRSWRHAAREDPSLWRHVDMRDFYCPAYRKNARPGAVARAAVRFSAAIARMHQLRSLQLFRINLSNERLAAILDGCPHLEYLDVRNCCNIIMDDNLRAKCARIKKKKLLVYRSNDECMDFEPGSPISYCSYCCGMGDESDGDNDILDIADLEDFSDSSYDLSGVDEIDIDEHDRIIEKIERRYL
ncbi:hypothetical protein HU200_047855 [Digitaria exilis]|uniref:F-box/LRR-repeat protein 15/At3g58940/PEG3-like LRR domain-containing protein n=1 Tax=Digitaria exilis TaxID=1010633 RepID=A0A835AVT4_9POAL|nr:hypothetical protein HU200_047855 [Digitaria exilis]